MLKKLDIVALVPARSGSKGIKDKNILLLNNHPLISYSITVVKQSKMISDVYVSTNSEKYSKIALSYGALVPSLRPKDISLDSSLDKEFFMHFIGWYKKNRKKVPDLIVHLRPTTPLRDYKKIDDAIKYLINHPKASSLRSCQNTQLTPFKMFFDDSGYMMPFMVDKNYPESYNQPRQKFPKTYLPNGYVDIIRPKILLETGLLHGDKILLYETPITADIDDINDYESAKQLLNNSEYLSLKEELDNHQL